MKNLNRRIFLRGLGGAVVAAPFLSSVAERAAKAQSTPALTPKRLIVMFTHYGCLTNRWFPTNAHGPLTAADYEGTTLAPFAPIADKILLPRGIRAMNEWSFGGELGQINDPHTQVCGSYFSCYPVTPNGVVPEGQFLPPNDAKFNAVPTGRTLDHIAAEQVSEGGQPLFMRVGGSSDGPQSAISYSAPMEDFPGVGTPTQVFSTISNMFMDGGPVTPDDYAALKGQSIIDIIRDDLTTLEMVDMSASDKQKLADWKELLHSTGNTVTSAQCNQATADALGLTTANLSAVQTGFGANLQATIADGMDAADVYSNLAVLAALCQSNNVIFLKYPAAYTFTGHPKDIHGISHRIGDAGMGGTCLSGVMELIHEIDTYYAAKFAYLVNQLNSFDEGDVKALDNTACVWFQELSDGNSHNLNNMPIVHAGSCGGYFKTGWAVNCDDGDPGLTVGNSEGECQNGMTAQNLDSVGTPASMANAPINKYYCALLNAIGVKAGSDGFPAVGGTEPVTRFGKYDDSAMFSDGGTAPPTHNDPGEFEELRANA